MAATKVSREWVLRCARRIVEVEPQIQRAEAREIASRIGEVERLCAMQPEAAVDFIQAQAASDAPSRYERRQAPR